LRVEGAKVGGEVPVAQLGQRRGKVRRQIVVGAEIRLLVAPVHVDVDAVEHLLARQPLRPRRSERERTEKRSTSAERTHTKSIAAPHARSRHSRFALVGVLCGASLVSVLAAPLAAAVVVVVVVVALLVLFAFACPRLLLRRTENAVLLAHCTHHEHVSNERSF
jgi:hypothetical protein